MSDLQLEILRQNFVLKDGCRLMRKTGKRAGYQAGTPNGNGYVNSVFKYQQFVVHRAIFALAHGYYPKQIDHIDGNRQNNHVSNLRECNQSQNLCNRGKSPHNKSGYKGVSWSEKENKWVVYIKLHSRTRRVGCFVDPFYAHMAYQQAAHELHGDFARSN